VCSPATHSFLIHRRNGTVWELAEEFTGSWRISTTNTTLANANITLFPLVIPNLSLALIDPDNVQLVKLFGEFEANTQTKLVRHVY